MEKTDKNIQVIDSAVNCTYSIFSASREDFNEIFPDEEQDFEFIDDFIKRAGKNHATTVLNRIWAVPVDKKFVSGIHGTLFYELEYKRKFYPTKREKEMVTGFP